MDGKGGSSGVPEGWRYASISDFSPYITSGSRGWAQYYSDFGDLFVRITNLTREQLALDLSDNKFVQLPQNSNEGKRTQLRAGDILISITADLGITSYIEGSFDKNAYINQHIALLRINDPSVFNKFIAYQMASPFGHNQFLSLNDAGAKSGLNLDSIRKFSVTLPPLEEQRKIADILSAWDEAIEQLTRLLELKRERKRDLMQQLLTGKVRFKEFEGLEWSQVTLRDCARCLDNRRVPLNSDERKLKVGRIPYWGANGIVDHVDDFIFDETLVLLAEDGGYFEEYKSRPIANISYGKAWVNNHAHVLTARENATNEWLYYSLLPGS